MPRLPKLLIGIGFTLLVVLIALVLFLRHLVTKSYPQTAGSENLPGVHNAVSVARDGYGVPHIRAKDAHDLMMAVGYVHAQDRLWQMDLLRRAGDGRLSEVMGGPTTDIDRLFRTINLRDLTRRMEERLHPESRELLQAYAAGVNAFIASHESRLPVEFDMLNYRPEPWTVRHSLLIARLIGWELNLAWWTDLVYGEIATRVPAAQLQEIIPDYPDSLPVTVPPVLTKKSLAGVESFRQLNRAYRDFFHLGQLSGASNAWVVDSSRSLSGKPLLANDPHLAMPAPARWYIVHLSAPGWNVAGVTIPGIPFVIIGHNDQLAWGFTNAMLDDADFYIEQTDTTRPDHYKFQSQSLPFEQREEKIFVGTSDSLVMTVRSTHHGPIINDVHATQRRQDSAKTWTPISMRWSGFEMSDEAYGFYKLNIASNPREFEDGIRELTVPGQSVVYADVMGNIAYWTAGRVPMRGKLPAMLPLPGATGEGEWNGFVPFNQLPKLINPPEGFIACANQRIADRSYPYYLSTLWEPPSRIQRIRQLLQSTGKFTADDFKQFQQDVSSPYAQAVTARLLAAARGIPSPSQEVTDALNYLQNWDYRFTQTDIATTIFNVVFVRLLQNTFADEMGPGLFKDFLFFGAIPTRVMGQLLTADSSKWFDNITTPQRESRDDILRKSLTDGVDDLRTSVGTETKTWRWGTLHTVTFRHPFGTRKPLDMVFDVGPFPVSGGGTTVSKCEFKLSDPYTVSVGPSMRQVIDLADPLTGFTVITSGQSGQPLQKHYDDQVPLWLNGGYLRVTMDWNEIDKSDWDRLELTP